jgi:mycothiol synthase
MLLLARDRSGWVTRWNAGPDRPCDPAAHIRAALAEAAAGGGGQVVLWVERVDASLDSAARAAGMQHWRTLLQMRRALPATPSALHTRAFTEADADAFIALNNRAFSWHPEQGGWTPQHLALHYTEPWFCADGFRVHERDGQVDHTNHNTKPVYFRCSLPPASPPPDAPQLAAVCWTKIHPACAALDDPELGEVYVAAVDPALQRQGLGAQVTLAG